MSWRRSLAWAGGSQAARVGLQLISIVLLARLLTPSDFGVVAIASTVTALGHIFRDLGMAAAVIQRPAISDELKTAVFIANLLIGFAIFVFIYAVSEYVGRFFHNDHLGGVLQFAAVVFPCAALGAVSQALLERRSDFRQLAKIEVLASCLGTGLALSLAYRGWGAYSLVAQTVTTVLLSSVMLIIAMPWSLRRPSLRREFGGILSFSGNLFSFNILNYFIRNLDSLLVGKYLGTAALGVYNVSYRTMLFPLQNITSVIGRVSLPIYSHAELEATSSAYLKLLAIVAWLVTPIMAFVAFEATNFVLFFLGENWLNAAEVIIWMAPIGAAQALVGTSGALLTGLGRTDLMRNLGLGGLLLFATSFFIGVHFGLGGFVKIYCLANVLWFFVVFAVVSRQLKRPVFSSVAVVAPAVGVTAVALCAAAALKSALIFLNATPLLHLVLTSIAFSFAYVMVFKLAFRREFFDLFRAMGLVAQAKQ